MTRISVQERQGLEELFLCLGKQQERRCPRALAKGLKRRVFRFLAKARLRRRRAFRL